MKCTDTKKNRQSVRLYRIRKSILEVGDEVKWALRLIRKGGEALD